MTERNKRRLIPCALALVAFVLSLPFTLAAQVPAVPGVPDSEGIIGNNAPLISLTFTGLSQFTDAQATQVSGLHLDQIVDKDDFKAAANRLAQSGGFDKVAYKFNSGPKGVTLEFDLTETSRMIRCILDNFVWFSKDEITAALQKTAPLFGDKIPADGPTVDQVEAGLRALLQSNSILGDVQKIGMAGSGGGNSVTFRVTGVSLPVTAVEFPGASSARRGDLQGAAFGLVGQDFSAYDTATFAAVTLTSVYRRDGFFHVHFASPQGRLGSPANTTPYNVVVTIPVDEGAQYTWGGQTWSGNQAVATGDLDTILGMAPKAVADGDKLDTGLAAISRSYSAHGYIDFALRHKANFDDDTHIVSYDFTVVEGPQYHMGKITFAGVSDSTAKKLASQWQLKPGDIYDGTYFVAFFKKTALPKLANGKPGVQFTPSLKRDQQTATVDVTIIFQ